MKKIMLPIALITLISTRYCLSAADHISSDITQPNQSKNVENIEKKERYPLHTAAISRNLALAQKLIDEEENINMLDSDGLTPLNYAMRTGNRQLINLLQDHGALLAGEKPIRRKRK